MVAYLSLAVSAQSVQAPHRIHASEGVSQGLLIEKVNPVYPPLARQARIQGTVELQAVIGKDGAISELKLVSGHPMLVTSAIDAVKQWRYRPYYLNGEPVEVDTRITVNYTLGGSAPPPKKPLSIDDIKALLQNSVAPKRVAELIREFGVDFDLGGDRYKQLKDAGATDEVFTAVSEAKR